MVKSCGEDPVSIKGTLSKTTRSWGGGGHWQSSVKCLFNWSFSYVVLPCWPGAVCHCQTYNNFVIQSKTGEAIMQCSWHKTPGGQSVQFLNRFRTYSQSSNRIKEILFVIWCLVDKFSPRIYAHHLGQCWFMANKTFVKKIRLKLRLSQLVPFSWRCINEEWTLTAPKSFVFRGHVFCIIHVSDHRHNRIMQYDYCRMVTDELFKALRTYPKY